MNCKCGKPVEKSIEGEIICEDCWTLGQMSPEDKAVNDTIKWFDTHCGACEKKCKPNENGYCKECQAELEEIIMMEE